MRPSERVVAAYFVYAAGLAVTLPVRPSVRGVVPVLNLTILAGYALLIHAHGLRSRAVLGVLRDFFPFPLLLLGYREMGWFAQPHTSFRLEELWVGWDRMLLYGCGLKAAVEAAGPVLPGLLEVCYTLVYTLGLLAAVMIYVWRRPERMERLVFLFALGTLLAYAQFPWWPSEPPRTVFAGRDAPAYDTIFRRFNWWMLGGYGIHTSVFPSAHVAGAFSAAWGARRALPEKPWLGRSLLLMAVLIATATVYGRYHYLADAAAGFLLSLGAWGVAVVLDRWRNRQIALRTSPQRVVSNG